MKRTRSEDLTVGAEGNLRPSAADERADLAGHCHIPEIERGTVCGDHHGAVWSESHEPERVCRHRSAEFLVACDVPQINRSNRTSTDRACSGQDLAVRAEG